MAPSVKLLVYGFSVSLLPRRAPDMPVDACEPHGVRLDTKGAKRLGTEHICACLARPDRLHAAHRFEAARVAGAAGPGHGLMGSRIAGEGHTSRLVVRALVYQAVRGGAEALVLKVLEMIL